MQNQQELWNQFDLIRRVVHILDLATQMVQSIVQTESERASQPETVAGFLRNKVVAETAMLLLCVNPIQTFDQKIQDRVEILTRLLIPQARHQDIFAALCLDPGQAYDHAIAHAILSRLGFTNPDFDVLLVKSMALGTEFGPERLPHRRLEQAWLARAWNIIKPPRRRDAHLLADSMLGRPLDALGCSRLDLYAFTHSAMYASDLGLRKLTLNRSKRAISNDAEIALSFSLDTNDFDLTAEILLSYPMLGLRWSAAAIFAFGVLTQLEDSLGFLPGLAFDQTHHKTLSIAEKSKYALSTSYHTMYVMGFLCAIALRPNNTPPATIRVSRRSNDASSRLLKGMDCQTGRFCWVAPLARLEFRQQASLAPLLLAISLRRAKEQGNLKLVREALQIALEFDLVNSPASIQAVGLFNRIQTLKT